MSGALNIRQLRRDAIRGRQRRETLRLLHSRTTTAGAQPTDPHRDVTEHRAEGGGTVALAHELRPAVLTPSEPLTHRGNLSADDLRLSGCRQPFALVQRQADGFRDREIVALNPGHLGLGHGARPKLGNKLYPPYQLRHRSRPCSEASGYPTTNELPTTSRIPSFLFTQM